MAENELFDQYCDSVFKHSNEFSVKEYEEHRVNFESNYGQLLPKDIHASFLDIGSGAGHFLYYLKSKGYDDFRGIDISPQQIALCKEKVSDKVVQADCFEYLRDTQAQFDVITANDVLEHITKEKTIRFLSLVYQALKPNGIMIIKTPNLGNPLAVALRYKDFTHEIGFTEHSLYQVFWLGGFRSIRILPARYRGFLNGVSMRLIHGVLRKLFWYQGFVAPKILSHVLIGCAQKTP